MTISHFISITVQRLSTLYPAPEAKAMAVRLLQHYCGLSSYEHLVEPGRIIDAEQVVQLEDAAGQLAKSRPLQYVIGWQEFCGLKIEVQEGVLIPRPETEELVIWAEEFLREYELEYKGENDNNKISILDAACGSGAIAAAMAKKFPGARVYACDISEKALEITRSNFQNIGIANASAFRCDLLQERLIIKNHFEGIMLDIIISNPPYVTGQERAIMRLNVLDYEPQEALFVPDEDPLLFYKALESIAREYLVPGGAIFMEINEQFAKETAALFKQPYFAENEIHNDINDKPRMVKAVRAER